jgi:hypothetical protein
MGGLDSFQAEEQKAYKITGRITAERPSQRDHSFTFPGREGDMNNQINIKVTSTIVSVYYRERAVNSLAYCRANWEQRQIIVVK